MTLTSDEMNKMVPAESLDTSITNVLNQYNDKYGTAFKYQDFKDSLLSAANITANEKEIRRVINSEIITNIADIITTKSILVISKVISDQLDRISKITEKSGLSGEIVSMVSEMFGWVEKLEEIKKKYQLFDVDSKIKDLLRGEATTNLSRTPDQQAILNVLKSALIK
jgi:Ca2+-binding EF-hand superfamily protein